jgi:microcystin-dependent protein
MNVYQLADEQVHRAHSPLNSSTKTRIIIWLVVIQLMIVSAFIIMFSYFTKTAYSTRFNKLAGLIQLYAGDKEPELPWLLCNGSNVSRSRFPELFSVIGTIYGRGDGNLTFSLPDFRKRLPMGTDALRTVGRFGGRESHQLSIDELPSHSHGVGNLQTKPGGVHKHNINDPGHNHTGQTHSGKLLLVNFYTLPYETRWGLPSARFDKQQCTNHHNHSINSHVTGITLNRSTSHSHKLNGRTDYTGQGDSFSLIQPFISVNFIIYSA